MLVLVLHKCTHHTSHLPTIVAKQGPVSLKKSSKDLGISERILQVRKHFALSYDALADKVGASGQAIANIEQGKSNNPGAELLVNMATMLGIRLDWLLLGEGEMLRSESKSAEAQESFSYMQPNLKDVADPAPPQRAQSSENVRILPIQVAPDGDENIEYVPVWAAAGYAAGGFFQPTFIEKLPSFRLPGATFRNGSFRAFQVNGSSMQGTLQDGDLVICRYVENWAREILDNRVYVVVSETDVLVKRVLNQLNERGRLTLHSDNPSFDVQEMYWEDVREVWLGVGRLTVDLTNSRFDVPVEFAKLQAVTADVLRRLDKLEGNA